MSSSGNIYLQHNPDLENSLVRLKELDEVKADTARLVAQVEALLEAALAGAIAAQGETAQRALGAVGAYRVLLAIIRDADGAEYRPRKGQGKDGAEGEDDGAADEDDGGEDEE